MIATVGSVSVIVLAYQNDGTLPDAVRSVLEQDVEAEVEVIVVASGVEEMGVLPSRLEGARVIESRDRMYPGEARNRGVAVARGDVIAFLAADCLAEPGWLQARVRAHSLGHGAVGSAITNAEPRGPWGWGYYYSLFPNRLANRSPGKVAIPDPAVHSTSFLRDVLVESGPFAEDVVAGEDTDMIGRMNARGVDVWFEPSARTAHRGPRGASAVVRDQWGRGRARAATDGGHRPTYPTWPGTLRQGFRRARYVLGAAWRYGRGERVRIAFTAPWTALCAVVNQCGWGHQKRVHFVEQRTAVGSFTPRPEEE